MQSDQQFYSPKAVPRLADHVDDNYIHMPVPSAFGTVFPPCAKPLPPLHGIEFQPSEVCPKNFVIFNQNDHRNQIMFNPAVANKFNGHGLNVFATYLDGNTARTSGNYESDSDSHSAYGSKPRKNSSCSSTLKSSGSGFGTDPKKRLKMKKMVKVLRGIVPGADQMGTVAVLDEAVRYLKSLKVEVKKLGVENFKNGD
ncbi:hypothetical protein GOBAR_DD22614 [Gossypium barbadense]|nr:hypothetical protein GOBAR_DD22614 [Gossypium barbadense]